MLEQLQRELKRLIRESKHEDLFILLDKYLRNDCNLYNEILLLDSSLSTAEAHFRLNLIKSEELRAVIDRVNYSLVRLISQIRLSHLAAFYKQKFERYTVLSDYHAFTCDRVDHHMKVVEAYFLRPDLKIHHFFLYGDARQGHKSLFERFHRYFSGTLDNWEDPDAQPCVKVKVIECQPSRCGNATVYQIDFLNKILSQCKAEPSLRQKMMHCRINDLVKHSELKHYESHDFVFVLLTVNVYNWTLEIPKVVDLLINGFCNCQLDKDSPNFFFFYGISYGSDKPEVKEAAIKAVKERASCIIELPELQPITNEDVNAWFSLYPNLIPKGKSDHEMSTWLFGEKTEFDMVDVEGKLVEIIELNNNGMLLQT